MHVDKFLIFVSLLIISSRGNARRPQPPHIIVIYADDLGWNDVSFHGSPQVPTPNIDALAMNGILLHNYYAESMCTPSRGALLTGKYPIRMGIQHLVFRVGEASALPLEEVTMAQHLKSLGYSTHLVGKWHLGYMKKEYTPTFRGFDTFFGYYNGLLDYYDYTTSTPTGLDDTPFFTGIDLRNGTELMKNFRGQYATHVFTHIANHHILNHDKSKPLFLYLSHLAVHTGTRNQLLQAPPEVIRRFTYIKDMNRRIHAAMIAVLDESVGNLFKALHAKNMLNNSIIVFASDNGGEVGGIFGGYSSNYPLRGKKTTLWEGGVRVPAFIWSPLLKLKKPKISDHLMHVTDWLPTFYSAAGCDPEVLGNIDGTSMWKALKDNLPSPRTELLHNIDPISGNSALRRGDWKLVNGSSLENSDSWYGPTGTEDMDIPESMEEWIDKSGSVVSGILKQTGLWINGDINKWYQQSEVTCSKCKNPNYENFFVPQKPQLFNIKDDPCEIEDLAEKYPMIVNSMMKVIFNFENLSAPPQSKPSDPRGNPMCYDFAVVSWMDSKYETQYKQCDF